MKNRSTNYGKNDIKNSDDILINPYFYQPFPNGFFIAMVLIYSHITSPRLRYIVHFIFDQLLGVEARITINSEEFMYADGVKINYSPQRITTQELHIVNNELLFETSVKAQEIDLFQVNDQPAFFKTPDSDLPFDIFSASFYLITRYEEYLPHERDMYGRYAHENSLAFKHGFLQIPLINIWVNDLATILKNRFEKFEVSPAPFSFLPTYDIDIAYSYKHKGMARNIGGFVKSPSIERLKVLTGLQQDPYDAFDWLHQLHQRYQLPATYFFLLAERNGKYDKNISPNSNAMWKLVKQHAKKYTTGIHPSWQSGDENGLLQQEIEQLEAMSDMGVKLSRQHYIRFNLPEGYRRLQKTGITADYSMGYGSINGFRASIASPFYWYDLPKDTQTNLLIYPFCYMEANSFFEQKFTVQQAFDEMMHYYQVCRAVNGQLITIWHNNFLGTEKTLTSWRDAFERFVAAVCKS